MPEDWSAAIAALGYLPRVIDPGRDAIDADSCQEIADTSIDPVALRSHIEGKRYLYLIVLAFAVAVPVESAL